MSERQLDHLRALVRLVLREQGYSPRSHPEYDDLFAEAVLAAWRAVSSMRSDSRFSWKTIASREARWQVMEYLRERRSGRITCGRLADPRYRRRHHGGRPLSEWEERAGERPVSLSSLPEPFRAPAWDGGIGAADARLQLWLLRPRLTTRQRQVLRLLYDLGLSHSEAARRLGITWHSLDDTYRGALKKYRALVKEP